MARSGEDRDRCEKTKTHLMKGCTQSDSNDADALEAQLVLQLTKNGTLRVFPTGNVDILMAFFER